MLEFRKWHLILRFLVSWPELPLLMEEREKKLVCGGKKGEREQCMRLLCPDAQWFKPGGQGIGRRLTRALLSADDNGSCSWIPGDFWDLG